MLFILIFLTISPQASYSEDCKSIFSDNTKEEEKSVLENTLESLGLSSTKIQILNENNITSVGDLTEKMTERKLLNIEGIGTSTLNKIKAGLEKRGLSLKEEEKSVLENTLESLGLSSTKIQILNENNITSVGDLTEKMTERKLLNIEGIGTITLDKIKAGLGKRGLSLKEEEKPVLENTLESLVLSYKFIHILNKNGITSFGDLIEKMTERKLLNIKGIGTGTLNEIKEGLDKRGLSLALENTLESLGLSYKFIHILNKNGITSFGDLIEKMTERKLLNIEGIGIGTLNTIKAGLEKRDLSLALENILESLGLSSTKIQILNKNGITSFGDLTEMPERKLLNIEGIGTITLDKIKAGLDKRGLSLKEEEKPVLEDIESFGLHRKQIQILIENDITSFGDLTEMPEKKLLNIEGIGTITLDKIKAGLGKKGLSLKEEEKPVLEDIESFGLHRKQIQILIENDITSFGDLTEMPEKKLLNIEGIGTITLDKIKAGLGKKGLSLKEEEKPVLENTLESLVLSSTKIQILNKNGITSVGDLTTMEEGDLLKIPGFGVSALNKLKARLNERGLSLKEEEKSVLELKSLGLSSTKIQILIENGITSVNHLTEMTEGDVLKIHGFGVSALNKLKAGLDKRGLSLKEEEKSVLENEPESLTPFPTKIQKPKATGITEGLDKRGLSLKEEEKSVLELKSLGLSSTKIQILIENGITSVNHLTEMTEGDVLKIHGFGVSALNELKAGLDKRGLRLKSNDSIESWDFLSREIIDALNKEGIYFIDDLTEMTEKELLNIPGVEEHIFDEIKARLNERGLSLKEEENPV